MKDSSFVEVRAEQTPDNAEWFQARPTPCGDAAPVGLAAHPCADSPATSLNDGPEGIRHRAHGFPKSITVATTAVGRESAVVRHHAHPGGASRNSRNPRKKPFWTACPADGRFLARWASMSSASTPWKTADHPCLLHRFRPRDHPAALGRSPCALPPRTGRTSARSAVSTKPTMLTKRVPEVELYDPDRPIYTNALPAASRLSDCQVTDSLICDGCHQRRAHRALDHRHPQRSATARSATAS